MMIGAARKPPLWYGDMQDYYETLQVHPKADADAIRAAYERLRGRYDATLLEGAADELRELARRRRDEIERAYTVLSDPIQRAAFDREVLARRETTEAQPASSTGTRDDIIDYRPLPPAIGQERARGFNAQPYLAANAAPRPSGRRIQSNSRLPTWLPLILVVAIATFALVLFTLLSTVWNIPQQNASTQPSTVATSAAPTPSVDELVNQFEGQIAAARQVANQVPDNFNAWVNLGNALFDSTVIVRELIDSGHPSSDLQTIYVERLPRWIEASDAYRKALAITPGDAKVRADMAAALCYYGSGVKDQSYINQGLEAAEQALRDAPEEGRALLSKGVCLILSDPPQTAAALGEWQKITVMPNVETGVAQHARQLIATYSE